MLSYKVGDLLEAAKNGDVQAIAHCCNCFNSMGSGIAPLIKKTFPYAYAADLETSRGDRNKLGTLSLGCPSLYDYQDLNYNLPFVFNLYGQYGYNKRKEGKRDLDYNALYDALEAMKIELDDIVQNKEDFTVGFPLIGAGLAGGNWKIISTMIEQTLDVAGYDVVIYVLDNKTMESIL